MTLFEKISDELSQKIKNGYYSAGEELPNESDLQKIYDVSRTTVRKAIDNLVDENMVIRKKGVGLFVAPSISNQNILEMTGVMKSENIQIYKQQIKEEYLRQAGEYFGKILQIKKSELVYYVNFIESGRDGITKEVLVLPLKNYPDFRPSSLKVLSIIENMNTGIDKVYELKQDLKLIKADHELSKQLEIGLEEPVFKIYNKFLDQNGKPVGLEYRYKEAMHTKYVIDFD